MTDNVSVPGIRTVQQDMAERAQARLARQQQAQQQEQQREQQRSSSMIPSKSTHKVVPSRRQRSSHTRSDNVAQLKPESKAPVNAAAKASPAAPSSSLDIDEEFGAFSAEDLAQLDRIPALSGKTPTVAAEAGDQTPQQHLPKVSKDGRHILRSTIKPPLAPDGERIEKSLLHTARDSLATSSSGLQPPLTEHRSPSKRLQRPAGPSPALPTLPANYAYSEDQLALIAMLPPTVRAALFQTLPHPAAEQQSPVGASNTTKEPALSNAGSSIHSKSPPLPSSEAETAESNLVSIPAAPSPRLPVAETSKLVPKDLSHSPPAGDSIATAPTPDSNSTARKPYTEPNLTASISAPFAPEASHLSPPRPGGWHVDNPTFTWREPDTSPAFERPSEATRLFMASFSNRTRDKQGPPTTSSAVESERHNLQTKNSFDAADEKQPLRSVSPFSSSPTGVALGSPFNEDDSASRPCSPVGHNQRLENAKSYLASAGALGPLDIDGLDLSPLSSKLSPPPAFSSAASPSPFEEKSTTINKVVPQSPKVSSPSFVPVTSQLPSIPHTQRPPIFEPWDPNSTDNENPQKMQDIVESAFRQMDATIGLCSQLTGQISKHLISAYKRRFQARHGNAWNGFQKMLKDPEEFLGVMALLEGTEFENNAESVDELDSEQTLAAYDAFKESYGLEAGPYIENWVQESKMHSLVTKQERQCHFDRYFHALTTMAESGHITDGFETVIISVGRVINSDAGLGQVYVSPGAQGFIERACRMPTNKFIAVYKAHVYDKVATKIISKAHSDDKADDNKACGDLSKSNDAPLMASLSTKTKTLAFDASVLEDDKQLTKYLRLGLIDRAYKNLDIKLSESNFLWKNLLNWLAERGYAIRDYPAGAECPSESNGTGLGGVAKSSRKLIYKSLFHDSHPLTFVVKSKEVLMANGTPVLRCVPLSDGSPGREVFYEPSPVTKQTKQKKPAAPTTITFHPEVVDPSERDNRRASRPAGTKKRKAAVLDAIEEGDEDDDDDYVEDQKKPRKRGKKVTGSTTGHKKSFVTTRKPGNSERDRSWAKKSGKP
ncbi:hypothetical protein C8J56DRAFT_896716 [Mycena floridula]|nr:hypothetical protein C8J56DRAFT_896716 [Mycena floridula]